MDEVTFRRAMAVLAELRRVINEAADRIEASKQAEKAKAA